MGCLYLDARAGKMHIVNTLIINLPLRIMSIVRVLVQTLRRQGGMMRSDGLYAKVGSEG